VRGGGDGKYIPAIDGLRAVAVVAVIINHFAHQLLPSGYLGVDVFFVISGFVITLSLLDRPATSTGSAIAEFYARRFKRLIPALALAVLTGAVLIRLFDNDPNQSLITGATAMFGLSNLWLFYQARDYFGASAQLDPFTHTWSLGVEEQFYLLFPALLLLGGLRGRLGLTTRFRVLAVLVAASLVGFVAVYPVIQPAAYFLLPFRFWELGAGCLLAMLAHTGRLGARRAGASGWLEGCLALLVASFFIPADMPVLATVVTVVLSVATLVLIWRAPASGWADTLLSRGLVFHIGLLSYSLYLWHWIVICISRWTIGISWWTAPLQLAAIYGLAAASYYLVENPLRRRPWFGGRGMTIATGLAAIVFTAGVVLVAYQFRIPGFAGERQAIDVVAINTKYTTRHSGRLLGNCEMTAIYSGADRDANLARCTAEVLGADLKLIFVGDSHSNDLAPLADLLYANGKATVTNLFQPSCQVPPPAKAGESCGLAMSFLNDLPPATGRTAVVIRNNIAPKRARGDFTSFTEDLEALSASLVARGYEVIYVAPAPKYDSVGPGTICSRQWFRPEWALPDQCRAGFLTPRGEQLTRRDEIAAYLTALEHRMPTFRVFDPFDFLCGELKDSCTPIRDGKLIYRDESHLTEGGGEMLYVPFLQFLEGDGLLPPDPPEVQARFIDKPSQGAPAV